MRGYRNYNSNPHPGDLREKIDIVREANVINANGYPEARHEVVYESLWAAIDDAGNKGGTTQRHIEARLKARVL